jgi:hypothetical protein
MSHRFVILRRGVLETYTQYEDIPQDFEHVIEFIPDIPDGPHTDEQHEEIDQWNDRLQELMAIERSRYASSN